MLADSQGRQFRIVTRASPGVKRLGVTPAGLQVVLQPVKRDVELDPSTTVQVGRHVNYYATRSGGGMEELVDRNWVTLGPINGISLGLLRYVLVHLACQILKVLNLV